MARTLTDNTRTVLVLVVAMVAGAASSRAATAEAIYNCTGVKGGLVAHVGCGDGSLTAELRANDRYLVQGLVAAPEGVRKAQERIHTTGAYGAVAADVFDGHRLPFVEDLVNLVIVSAPCNVPVEEIARVLAPRGIVAAAPGTVSLEPCPGDLEPVTATGLPDGWALLKKRVPEDTDEWSHFLHDASGDATAKDRRVGPPARLRWVSDPKWCRSHEFPSSVNAVVTAGGRIFMIFDEGQTGIYNKLPQRCNLIAQDAANGVRLWQVPLSDWQPEFGTGQGNRWNIHHTIPRRLVACGDRVYATLRFLESPVSVLDAATGDVLVKALDGTTGADEMILDNGILIVKTTKERSVSAGARIDMGSLKDNLVAVDVKSGKQLWRKDGVRVIPYALSAQSGRVVYHDMEHLICLDAGSGSEVWRAANPTGKTQGAVSSLAISDGVVLFHGHGQVSEGEPKEAPKKARKPASGRFFLTAFSLDDGGVLWRKPGRRGWAAACTQPTDLFVTNGTVWCGSFQGCDLRTGEIRKTVSVDNLISPGHHYRCHRSKATERFLILPKRGAEFVDVEGDGHMRNDWLRAPCFTGATPANGLFYAPTDQCFCYPGVKVPGFLAMAPGPVEKLKPVTDANLERGPAYAWSSNPKPKAQDLKSSDWPMYRRDTRRSGSTSMAVPVDLALRWEAKLACQPSQAVVVGDRLWVAEKDARRIRCLNANDGSDVWSYTAGGRIDSAPTIHEGTVLFGCRDGSVYCLRAADGALVWRFRAAPNTRQLVSYGQLESVWPVQGSVLVQKGVVYFAAGRSSFLDGGIMVYGVDATSGKMLHSHLLEGPWPDIKTDTGTPFAMEGALPDLLVSDGRDLYMQRIKFDAQLNRLPVKQESPLGELDMGANHLVATGGFLDDSGFDRIYWMHSHRWPGFYFAQQAPKAGQLLVFDDSTTYAVKYFYRRIVWSPAFFPGEHGYLLFADENDNQPTLDEKGQKKAIDWLPKESAADRFRRGGRGVEKGTGYVRERPAKWQTMVPLRIRAMVLAAGRLFAAGTPDAHDPDDPMAALEGRKGVELQVFSAQDGSLLSSQSLPAMPAFDGLSAANGRLHLATRDARLICLGGTDGR